MSTLVEIGDYLEAQGVGAQGTSLFLGQRPDQPDQIVFVTQYPGSEPEYVQNQFMPRAEKPQIQVAARALTYEAADDLITKAWRALATVTNADLGGSFYRSIRPNSSPGLMGRDDSNRVVLYFNASIEKEVALVP